ncbi:hypothetical protein GCM10028795_23590 [Lysobacter olei]
MSRGAPVAPSPRALGRGAAMAAAQHLTRVVPTVPVTSGTQCGPVRPAILSTPAPADTLPPARYNSRFHPRETAP